MNHHYILHYVVDGAMRALPWPLDLSTKRTVCLRAGNLGEAVAFSRAYTMIMSIVDLAEWDPNVLEALKQLEAIAPASRPTSMIGIMRFEPTLDQRRQLLEAGIDSVICEGDPPRMLLRQIDMLTKLADLTHFQDTQMDVHRLAAQTRERLHDLTQPLSAVQGRLQLLAAKCDKADPNAQYFRDLVRLIFDVSSHLMEIQKLHRTYS